MFFNCYFATICSNRHVEFLKSKTVRNQMQAALIDQNSPALEFSFFPEPKMDTDLYVAEKVKRSKIKPTPSLMILLKFLNIVAGKLTAAEEKKRSHKNSDFLPKMLCVVEFNVPLGYLKNARP